MTENTQNNETETLGEAFRRRQYEAGKPGTHTVRLDNLAEHLGKDEGAQLAKTVNFIRQITYTGHQMAGTLEAMVKEVRAARSYNHGNKGYGMASKETREVLGLNTVNPSLLRAQHISSN
jgi:hypothetical protein